MVRTQPFQGCYLGSNPGGVIMKYQIGDLMIRPNDNHWDVGCLIDIKYTGLNGKFYTVYWITGAVLRNPITVTDSWIKYWKECVEGVNQMEVIP